jgi:lipid-binding SYLF domain-containing protein
MNTRIPKPFGGAMAMFASIVLIAGGSTFVAPDAAAQNEQSKMSAADAAKKREAVLKMRDDALVDFYATKPEIKEELAKAIGYAVFDASQVNIVLFVGGLGGGVLVENGTGKQTFMKMTRAGTGPGVGYKKFRQLIVFKDRTLFDNFRTIGADIGASADATMKIGGTGVAVDPNVSFNPLLSIYQITDSGALLQANWGGVAYLPDGDLNPPAQ